MLLAVLCTLAAAGCDSPSPSAVGRPGTTAGSTSTTAAAAAVPARLEGVGSTRQAIVVTAASPAATTATFTAYEQSGGTWREVFGPWTAWVGSQGIAPPGEKREGDGRTPSGVYGLDFMFGVAPDPGVRFPYRRVTPSIVWDDDPGSPLYNRWVDRNEQTPGAEPEEMYQPVAYAHGVVIAYNAEAVPGLGSAIFLHASTGMATAGCVALPAGELMEVLRWLEPSRSPRIVLRVGSG